MTTQQRFTYLLSEDAAFAKGFNLSEAQVLSMYGGLGKYTQHRLARDRGRGAGFNVPQLPSSLENKACSDVLALGDVDERALAEYLVDEQMEKVRGVQSAIGVNTNMAAAMKAHDDQAAGNKESRMKALRSEGARRHGVKPDSTTALDYAERQFEKRYAHPNQYSTTDE